MPVFVKRDHGHPAAAADDLGDARIDRDAVEPDKALVRSSQQTDAYRGQHATGRAYQCRLATIQLADQVIERSVRALIECAPGLRLLSPLRCGNPGEQSLLEHGLKLLRR